MADPDPARLTIKAHGPDWWKSTSVEIDGKPIECTKLTVEIDPNENLVRATIATSDFDLELTDLRERVFEAPFYDKAAGNG